MVRDNAKKVFTSNMLISWANLGPQRAWAAMGMGRCGLVTVPGKHVFVVAGGPRRAWAALGVGRCGLVAVPPEHCV